MATPSYPPAPSSRDKPSNTPPNPPPSLSKRPAPYRQSQYPAQPHHPGTQHAHHVLRPHPPSPSAACPTHKRYLLTVYVKYTQKSLPPYGSVAFLPDFLASATIVTLVELSDQLSEAGQPDTVSLAMSRGCWDMPSMPNGGVACQTMKKRS